MKKISDEEFAKFFKENFIFENEDNTFTRGQYGHFCKKNGLPFKYSFLYNNEQNIVEKLEERGLFKYHSNMSKISSVNKNESVVEMKLNTDSGILSEECVPEVNDTFVEFGFYSDLCRVIESRQFFPAFITGLSGNGKTFSVEQACAHLDRKLVRVNITSETDEDDLLGGFRLVDGNTKWFDGPVIRAMKTGSILLLDEVDLASNRIMSLQPVLEGRSIFLKKINQLVVPVEGFNVVATANTKGQGSETGKFIGTNILNEAFLDRFPITFEQSYPDDKIETKILKNVFDYYSVSKAEQSFIKPLLAWAKNNRENYSIGNCTEVISTRRLVHIAQAFSIFRDRKKAINKCISRFDNENKTLLASMYEKFDESVRVDDTGNLIDRVDNFNDTIMTNTNSTTDIQNMSPF